MNAQRTRHQRTRGFTLMEVLVALVIVGTALGAAGRAVASLINNSRNLQASMLATWSAENRLVQLRLTGAFPPPGKSSLDCPEGDIKMVCQQEVFATPNPSFRRVVVSVFDADNPDQQLFQLVQLVAKNDAR